VHPLLSRAAVLRPQVAAPVVLDALAADIALAGLG
jgi:hypothetical protein